MGGMSSEKATLLEAYANLRVADIRDAMDSMGYHFRGSVHHSIRPLYRTRAFGIARTVRYLPYGGEIPKIDPEKYMQWAGVYYRDICPYPWIDEIEDGDLVVIDQSGVDAGLMGSENTLRCRNRGCRGIVTNGGVRDTDEIILQNIPFWSAFVSQTMVQGRLQYDNRSIPVAVGGAVVNPGDLVVADGDGVIVVPRAIAVDVARFANEEHERDKQTRRALYNESGRQHDDSVK